MSKDYYALPRGFDGESIETIYLILARVQALHDTDQPELDLFTEFIPLPLLIKTPTLLSYYISAYILSCL